MLRRGLLVTLLGLALSGWAFPERMAAQGSILYGGALGYEYGLPLALERAPGVINRYGFAGDGYSYNHALRGGGRLLFPTLFGDRLGLLAAANYVRSSGSFRSVPFLGDSVAHGTTGEKFLPTEEFIVTSDLKLVEGELRASLALTDAWVAELGGWGSLRMAGSLAQSERLLAPEGALFPNSLRERVVASGESIASGPFRYGLGLGTSFRIQVARGVMLRPELYARVDAALFDRAVGLRALSAGAGLALYVDPKLFPGVADTTVAPVVVEGRMPARTFALEASVRLAAGDAEDSLMAMITSESTRHRHYMPLVPAIFFDSASAAIPSRYRMLAGPGETPGFTRASLVRLAPIDLHHQTLNVLGLRLRGETEATVTLLGHASRGESPDLARQRAARVAAYLRDVWGIAGERITVKVARGPVLAAEERGVRIVSGSPRILAPLVSEWIVRDHVLPHIGLSRAIRAEAGVKQWEVTIRQGGDTISRYSSLDGGDGEGIDAAFRMREGAGLPGAPLVAELTVEDFTGARIVAADSIPVGRAEGDEGRITREVFSYTLAGLDLGDPVLDDANRMLLASMVASVGDGARVTITGGEGWKGGSVAEKIIDGLRGGGREPAELRVLGGSTGASPAGNLPEHRLLSDGARVMIEQEPSQGPLRSPEQRRP